VVPVVVVHNLVIAEAFHSQSVAAFHSHSVVVSHSQTVNDFNSLLQKHSYEISVFSKRN
jgi:hypothetical protein